MTNSDQLMLAAIKAQVPFRINDRDVTIDGGITTVSLFGKPIALISSEEKKITLYGQTPVSIKSARVFNTLMEDLSSCRMMSRDGQWIICGESGETLPVQDCKIVIPMRE